MVLKCLEKDPKMRFWSGKDLNERIVQGIKGELEEWPSENIFQLDRDSNEENQTGVEDVLEEKKISKKQL